MVIESHEMQQGCMKIMQMDFILDGEIAVIVRFTVSNS